MIGVRDLGVTFPQLRAPALDAVTFTLGPRSRVAIMGANGAGKSILLAAIAGLVPLRSGCVDVPGPVGIVFQDPAIGWAGASVEDEIRFALACRDIVGPDADERVGWALDVFGLGALRSRSPETLSGGEQQRLQLAAVMAATPRTLLLDEPGAHLDPTGAGALESALASPELEPEIVMRVTHDPEVALAADRLLVLARGRLIADGAPADLFRRADAATLGIELPGALTVARTLEESGLALDPRPLSWSELSDVRP